MGDRTGTVEVRFHGRGGQGAVTAAELLSVAAFAEGRFAQAFPSFGSERMGAPVAAYCRIAERPVRTRQPVVAPDGVVVGDVTLLHHVDLLDGLVPDGWVLVNAAGGRDVGADLGIGGADRRTLATVAATELGRELVGRPVPSAALLGGVAALCPLVSLASVQSALRARFPGAVGEGNAAAAAAGFHTVRRQLGDLAPAAVGSGAGAPAPLGGRSCGREAATGAGPA